MKRPALKLPFEYCDTPDLRVLDLSPDGIECIPVLGRTNLRSGSYGLTPSNEHMHEECIEISFCQRGELVFESMGREYAFNPGMVFVSRPDEPHRLRVFPKGLLMYWLFLRLPMKTEPILSFPRSESRWLVDSLLSAPNRLFRGGDGIRLAFQRVFKTYDGEPRRTPRRSLRLRLAVSDLLMSIIEASREPRGRDSSSRVKSVVDEIRANPAAPISIDSLVARLSMSPSHLINEFKRLTGLPPLAFRNSCRIAAAKRELEKGVRSMSVIAESLGYSSAQNFATQFRIATASTPSEWRNRGLSQDKGEIG